jgi:hypothetical protein
MSSLCKEIKPCMNEAGAGGAGGEGNVRGTRAVDFKQGTWKDGEFTPMKKLSPFQVSNFISANTHPLDFCVCSE